MSAPARRRWRFYETPAGRKPVREFLDDLAGDDAAVVLAAMRDVARNGLTAARHVRGDIYEVREDGDRQTFRILFAAEGRAGHVLLALEGFSKKSRKTPPQPSTWRSDASTTGGAEPASPNSQLSSLSTHR